MRLLDLLFPLRCAVCSAPSHDVCPSCIAALVRLRPPLCERCGAPTAWPVARCRECSGRRLAFASARAAIAYDRRARALIGAWKERGRRRLVALVADVVADALRAPAVDVLVAVPPDPDRGLSRGFHPAAQLAAGLGERWSLAVEPVLERTRASPRQRGLAPAERRRNAAGAFRARSRPPPRVGLVDDVYTTGATAASAASALRAAGARHVEVLAFARALRGG